MRLTYPKFLQVSYAVIPCALTLFLIVLGSINYQIQGVAKIVPFFAALSVFYWGLYNPKRLNQYVVLFIGLFQDVVYGTTLGATSLLLLGFLWAVTTQREQVMNQSFALCWLLLGAGITLFAFASWLLNSALVGYLVFDITLLYQCIISILCYPLLYKLFRLVDE